MNGQFSEIEEALYQLKKVVGRITEKRKRICLKSHLKFISSFKFSLNVFTEFSDFSDKNIIILKRLLGSNSLLPV